jgi:uncharacterized protein YbaR (Trm112 family)
MDPFLLLCCPACRGDLDRVGTDELHCGDCQFSFPIIEGIPVLFPCNVKERMDELFGRYWDFEAKAAMYDELVEGGESIFERYNHESEVYGLVRFYEPGRLDIVLDAGCGNGRFLETFPGSTFEALFRTRERGRGHFLVCGELEHLPFKPGTFGTVISCRVLQHLPAQKAAVEEICRVTRDGSDVIPERTISGIRRASIRTFACRREFAAC